MFLLSFLVVSRRRPQKFEFVPLYLAYNTVVAYYYTYVSCIDDHYELCSRYFICTIRRPNFHFSSSTTFQPPLFPFFRHLRIIKFTFSGKTSRYQHSTKKYVREYIDPAILPPLEQIFLIVTAQLKSYKISMSTNPRF